MNELSQYRHEWELWLQAMKESVDKWRCGDDHNGLNSFILAMQLFQRMIQQRMEQVNGQAAKTFVQLLPLVQELNEQVKREDIIAITDAMEYGLIPFCEEMKRRRELA